MSKKPAKLRNSLILISAVARHEAAARADVIAIVFFIVCIVYLGSPGRLDYLLHVYAFPMANNSISIKYLLKMNHLNDKQNDDLFIH